MMFITGVGPWELLFLLLLILLLFGAKRLPEIGSSLGKGIREFKGSLREIEGELKVPDEEKEGEGQSPDDENGDPRRLTTSQ